MFCSKCGTQNPDDAGFCSKCGNNLKENPKPSDEKISAHQQLHLISEEVEKLGLFYKLGFYIEGFFLLLYFSIFTLFIGPIIVYFWGKRGWPKNSLVKAVLYSNAYAIVIFVITIIVAAAISAFVFSTGYPGFPQKVVYDVGEASAIHDTLAGKIIFVNGSMVAGSEHLDYFNRTLTFKLTDGKATIDVVCKGDTSNLSPQAIDFQTTVMGQFNNNKFEALGITTDCSFKYEGESSVYQTSNW